MKKIIETALPLRIINESAMGDKAKKYHPGNMHLWWGRSPIASSSALLFAAIVDMPEDSNQVIELTEIIKGIASEQTEAFVYADKYLKTFSKPVVVDTFSGFGGLTMAAQKLGCQVESSDLNAVATMLTKVATEIPARFSGITAIHPGSQFDLSGNLNNFASDVDYYGHQIMEQIRILLYENYPKIDEDAFAWVWTRTTECPNPACRCKMPLSSSFELTKAKGREYWAEPVIENDKLSFKLHRGTCPEDKKTNKLGNVGSKFQCPFCGEIATDEYIKKKGKSGEIGMQIMAVVFDTKQGKSYLEPDTKHVRAAIIENKQELPMGTLPNNTRWFSPPGFGITEYKDLFTTRQQILLSTLCELIKKLRKEIEDEAIKAGMSRDKTPLRDGGVGAFAYSEAIEVYLALVVDKLANYHSTICTWDNRNGIGRAAFTRQAIPMTWTFVEENPFSKSTGNFEAALKSIVEAIEKLPIQTSSKVSMSDGTKRSYPLNSLLFTELPYYDNVGYADLSDYFYIWMRQSLKEVYPELFEKIVTSKEELSSIPEHYDNDANKAKEEYRKGLEELFSNFGKRANEEYPSIVFYEYSKEDDKAIKGLSMEYAADTPLEHLISCLMASGFQITAIWPVRTEKANDKFESFRIAVVFRKLINQTQQTTRRNFINILKRELPSLIDPIINSDSNQEDWPVSTLGIGLSIYTKYTRLLNADGSNMNIHDALQLIHQETEAIIMNTKM